jgi:hypothetical protein
MDYYEKYLKYKQKYLNLKNNIGGGEPEGKVDNLEEKIDNLEEKIDNHTDIDKKKYKKYDLKTSKTVIDKDIAENILNKRIKYIINDNMITFEINLNDNEGVQIYNNHLIFVNCVVKLSNEYKNEMNKEKILNLLLDTKITGTHIKSYYEDDEVEGILLEDLLKELGIMDKNISIEKFGLKFDYIKSKVLKYNNNHKNIEIEPYDYQSDQYYDEHK